MHGVLLVDIEIYPPPPKPSYPPVFDKHGNIEDPFMEEFHADSVHIPDEVECHYAMTPDGVFQVYSTEEDMRNNQNPIYPVPGIKKFYQDQDFISSLAADGPTKSFAYRRLRYLESKFQMYVLLNEYQEVSESKVV